MKLAFPETMPVSHLVELGRIYWGYPGYPRADFEFRYNGTTTVINLANAMNMMRDYGPDYEAHTATYELFTDSEEVGLWIKMRYL